MKTHLVCLAVLTMTVTAAFAQQWQRPANCAGPKLSLLDSLPPKSCGEYLCEAVSVTIEANRDGTCTSSVETDTLRMRRGSLRQASWIIKSVGDCSSGQCQFDPSDGIYFIDAPPDELRDPVRGLVSWSVWDMNTSGVMMLYEAHVVRKNKRGDFVSCCPVDPRIVND